MQLFEMSNEQRRIFINTAQLHEAYTDAYDKSRGYRGGMHWKKAKGREYLFRSRDRYGYGQSLGPRSPETEAICGKFHENKKMLDDKLSELRQKLREQARLCKAVKIVRAPRLVTAILRLLAQHNLMGRNLTVIGTNALYAYEASAGVFFESGLTSTEDMDILWDVRSRLRLLSLGRVDTSGLIGILRKADKTFDPVSRKSFRAVNQAGYMVDLVKPEPRDLRAKEVRRMGDKEDLEAAEIRNLDWLVSSPKFTSTVIGEDGFPASMTTPDPRAFALHKLWLGRQRDRNPIKKKRDQAQARAVCQLILQYLPAYPFDPQELKMFPKEIVAEATAQLDASDLPPGYDD
ncbi:MAG: GSU2403 family nucleotidyltransferase fold protein [Thermodesulfobacteriota bacterium]